MKILLSKAAYMVLQGCIFFRIPPPPTGGMTFDDLAGGAED